MTTKTELTPEQLEQLADKIWDFTQDDLYAVQRTLRYLAEILRGSEPVSHQFLDPITGNWCNYMNDDHRKNTIEAGYTERALYAVPQIKTYKPAFYMRRHAEYGIDLQSIHSEPHGDFTGTGWESKPFYTHPQPVKKCEWKYSRLEEGWETQCKLHQYPSRLITFKFCPFCGGEIVEVK